MHPQIRLEPGQLLGGQPTRVRSAPAAETSEVPATIALRRRTSRRLGRQQIMAVK
jgi:hypothetical protein